MEGGGKRFLVEGGGWGGVGREEGEVSVRANWVSY